MDLEQLLRPRRKSLVLAAESAIRDTKSSLPPKSQLNRLISICSEATCVEEISNYLRYQASRRTWSMEFANLVIAKIETPLGELDSQLRKEPESERDRARVAAWRLYAVFLARTLTYTIAVKENPDDRTRR